MRGYSAILLVVVSLATSCGRNPSLSDQIVAAGGAAALRRDCEMLLAEQNKTHKESWAAGDTNLPATITALRPQIVQAARYDGFPMMDIQISGGFTHRGLMVILTNAPPDFLPRKSNWQVTRISDGIFEYRE